MSAQGKPKTDAHTDGPSQGEEWVRVPAVVDANGDKVVVLHDERGHPHARLVAELIREPFVGPRSPGYVIRFKDGNRLNCELTNLEWVAAPATRDEAARARAIATRERADAMRRTLEGRPHSDSALLVAEDRLR